MLNIQLYGLPSSSYCNFIIPQIQWWIYNSQTEKDYGLEKNHFPCNKYWTNFIGEEEQSRVVNLGGSKNNCEVDNDICYTDLNSQMGYCKIILQMETGTPLVSQCSQFQESLPAKFSLKIVPWNYRMIFFGRLQLPSQSWQHLVLPKLFPASSAWKPHAVQHIGQQLQQSSKWTQSSHFLLEKGL